MHRLSVVCHAQVVYIGIDAELIFIENHMHFMINSLQVLYTNRHIDDLKQTQMLIV